MRLLCVVLSIALCACQNSADEKQTAASWAATLAFAGQQWVANSVPDSFIRTSVDAAKKELHEPKAQRLAAELRDAVEAHDKRRAAVAASQLDKLAKDLQR